MCLFVLGFLMCWGLTTRQPLWGHFVSSHRKSEKRDRRESRGDERKGQGIKRNRNERVETDKIKSFLSTLTCYKDSKTCPTVRQNRLDAPVWLKIHDTFAIPDHPRVLRFYGPVNPIGVMSSTVSLSNHTFLSRLSPLSGKPVLWTFFHQKLTTALLESVEGREWPQKIFDDQSPWKNIAYLAGVEPATSWSPVGCASNWATEVGKWVLHLNLFSMTRVKITVIIVNVMITWNFTNL